MLGPLTIENHDDIVAKALKLDAASVSGLICTTCVKEAHDIIKADFPSEVSELTQGLEKQCGPKFLA